MQNHFWSGFAALARRLGGQYALVLFLASGLAGRAQAQIKPRFTLAFDTSGSMLWTYDGSAPTYGDGVGRPATPAEIAAGTSVQNGVFYGCGTTAGLDRDCNGLPDDSRIAIAKRAVRNMLFAFGDVEWSLARFHQNNVVAPATNCKNYNGTNSCTAQTFGNPQCFTGGVDNVGCITTIPDACEPGLGGNASMRVRAGGNFNGCINYDGACPSQPGGVWTDLGDILVGFPDMGPFTGAGNEYALLKWVDNVETSFVNTTALANYCDHLTTGDCELRADGSTPLGGIMTAVRDYMVPIKDSEPALTAACRGYYTILLTDGDETCGDAPQPASTVSGDLFNNEGIKTYVIGMGLNSAALDTIAVNGGTGGAYFPQDENELSAALADIIAASIKVEVCNDVDDDCDGLVDEGFTKYCDPNTPPGSRTPVLCVEPNELFCDGIDDDCDGVVDEGLLNACGLCPGGVEVCNGIDDDCDGQVDEYGGVPGGICNCFAESCNDLDDDCDGQVDEGVTRPCGSDVGECVAGVETCNVVGSGWGACVGAVGPSAELCDGLDNDCDGQTDEGLTRSCGLTDVGECQLGAQACVGGVWEENPPGTAVCNGQIDPTAELCNGKDDDCDGTADDGNPQAGGSCGSDLGECVSGTLACSGGALVCQGGSGPTPEVCDGLDNDCDGVADDGNPGGGAVCGTDTGECQTGTELCVNGSYVCQGSISPIAELCNGLDDDCDGTVDDGNPGGGAVCGTSLGECSPGTRVCTGGTLVCDGAVGPVVETCNGLDDDCDGAVDDGNPGGGAVCGTNTGECTAGTELCVNGSYVCQGEIPPVAETCNGLDDDCDGTADDGNPEGGGTCGVSTGECVAGTVQCQSGALGCVGAIGPTAETCDNQDDDCDGVVDDGNPGGGGACGTDTGECVAGTQLCVAGSYVCQGSIAPVAELCNNQDDDCDGVIDNGNPQGGGVCGTSTGDCETGLVQCQGGALDCVGATGPEAETCNGEDDDCDGVIDNGNPGGGAVCGTDAGECVAGTQLCVAGSYVCQGEIAAVTETCNGLDDDCDGVADDGNPGGGGVCGATTGECDTGLLECQLGSLTCVGAIVPVAETCNGLDDDCDGVVDDGNPGGGSVCGTSTGECQTGTLVCVAGLFVCEGEIAPAGEVCNGLDDDCDAVADDGNPGGGGVCGTDVGECTAGVLSCVAGALECTGAVVPVPEVCNGLDDDCDGVIDNGNPGGGAVCGSSTGECQTGTEQCVKGQFVCEGEVAPIAEVCNGLDDDCDGVADNGDPGAGATCGSTVGECEAGTIHCVSGALDCVGETAPVPELCDGLDNDCNAIIDDGNPGGGAVCGTDTGECQTGAELCVSGAFVCSGSIAPLAELCNNKDDDCDGVIDDGNPQGGGVCGSDVGECVAGSLVCTSGVLACAGDVGPVPEICDGKDNNCNGVTDEGNPGGGGACGVTKGECRAGTQLCVNGAYVCQGEVTPQNELCDGKDNDCDDSIDEGNPGGGLICGIDTGECTKGTTSCIAGALVCQNNIDPLPAELCNGKDDDCDGLVDEGNPEGGGRCGDVGPCLTGPNGDEACGECEFGALACQGGALVCVGNTGPRPERCDGLDNDCDLLIDEDVDVDDPNLGLPCGVDTGECQAGFTVCTAGKVVCEGGVGKSDEICDGLDNDCDGVADDGIDVNTPCGTDVGECKPGQNVCDVNTGTLVCLGDIKPVPEVCDALDNDCDGLVDEDTNVGNPCGTDVGECKPGVYECSQGIEVCVGGVPPQDEVCDCADNDCDGSADEEAAGAPLCGGGSECVDCQCALPCNDADEFGIKCPTGKAPVHDDAGKCFCVAEVCNDADCAASTIEVNKAVLCAPGHDGVAPCVCSENACTHVCDGITCGEGTFCDPTDGTCQRETCLLPQFACQQGELCDVTSDKCVADPCATAGCMATQACRDGDCVKSCADVSCAAGEKCEDGECRKDPCLGKFCAGGETCDPDDGECVVPAACATAGCGKGFVCDVGAGCEPDPCTRTTCPDGQLCRDGQCGSRCGAGSVECDGKCVDPRSDPAHCGATIGCSGAQAGEACGANEVCSLGKCATGCADDMVACARGCIDPKSDEHHCGASGDCDGDHAGAACASGFECAQGLCRPIGVSQQDGGTSLAGGGGKADPNNRVLVAGGGGCACTVPATDARGGRGPWSLAGLGLVALVLAARRRGLRRAVVVAALALLLGTVASGCSIKPFCLDCIEDAGTPTVPRTDGGGGGGGGTAGVSGEGGVIAPDAGTAPEDAGKDASACLDRELCNLKDDDCDGEIDEGIDTAKDPLHCGGCNQPCRPNHAFGKCAAGKCTFTACDIGFVDADGDPDNGCEHACQAVPAQDDSVCDLRDNDCDTLVDEDVDTATDPKNCGGCNRVCRRNHAANGAVCVAGTCTLDPTMCDPGYYDIDGDPDNGCEYPCDHAITPEVCNLIDDDCNGSFDDGLDTTSTDTDPVTGTACDNDVGECVAGVWACAGGQYVCQGGVGPSTEVCDGLDNNCDGATDESDPAIGPCGETQGTCQAGIYVCTAGQLVCVNAIGPIPEVCDGLDNDCNGVIDNGDPEGGQSCGLTDTGECQLGTTTCSGGNVLCVGEIGPKDELCDDLDNDCDGAIDNGNPGGGAACGNSLGECLNGTVLCQGGQLVCDGGKLPEPELCDNKDNDCNGLFDDGNPEGGGACGSDVGECQSATYVCTSGTLVCQGSIAPVPEVCDGLDNDCDGAIDNGDPGGGATCGSDVGECVEGTLTCVSGALSCQGNVVPDVEVCDGKDNDCDGLFDEGNPGGGAACGSDVGECVAGVETCVSGLIVCQGEVTAVTEVCDGRDNDCDGVADDGNPGGGAVCGTDVGECVAGAIACISGALTCSGNVIGSAEVCDGKDNDCDGLFDEGNPGGGATCGSDVGECSAGVEACVSGTIVCSGAVLPGVEVCNGKDDDCDGAPDNGDPGGGAVCGTDLGECSAGVIQCTGGSLICVGAVTGDPEACDGRDNDCDGLFDEGNPGGGAVCGTNTGECNAGTLTCVSGTLVCAGAVVGPVAELCNGKDDDCDGVADNGDPGGGASCGTDVGECSTGAVQCTGGGLSCTGAVGPVAEVCDGKDNDCDGSFDEGNPGGGAACGVDTGECSAGSMTCVGGALVCTGAITPAPEVCDGKDNDCDGTPDDGDPGSGASCGSDAGECVAGTVHCTGGALSCVGAVGAGAELCDNKDNDCDGLFDEGNPGGGAACGTSTGECSLGVDTCVGGGIVCVGGVGPVAEVCDGLDNDCDSVIDNGNPGAGAACGSDVGECTFGTRQCVAGALVCTGGQGPVAETCNTLDDDCDGSFDEGNPGGGGACGSDVGECIAGVGACIGGVVVCVGEVTPVAEVCDGKDNDCDGLDDDGNPGAGGSCGTDVGECSTGSYTCSGGALVCVGDAGPSAELCDGKDNDCDGSFDEGNPQGGAVCGISTGECATGTMTCVSGGLQCAGNVGPTVEICDGKDNDCDGPSDETFSLATDVSNCGACNNVCSLANAVPKCESSTCQILACNPGFVDANGDPADGCELPCTFTGPEVCDGADNDCNGSVDDNPQLPLNFCGTDVGECVAGTVTCDAGALSCVGTVAPVTELCNGKDDDCDGVDDDGFGVGVACSVGTGACRVSGSIICNGPAATQCSVSVPGTPGNETCNNQDDDCDGFTDEVTAASGDPGGVGPDDLATVTIAGGVKVFTFEASRADASPASTGSAATLPCSTNDRIPWTDVTWDEAHDACCRLNVGGACTGNGGFRLCDSGTWESACKSSTGTCTWGYGTSCSTANGPTSAAQQCNGKEYDCNAGQSGDQDCRLATGSFGSCKSVWGGAGDIYDMSGNVKEWTHTQVDNGLFELRGGGYSNIEFGRTCAFDFAVGDQSFAFPNTGFRCCYYPAAVGSCISYTSSDVPKTFAGDTGTVISTLDVFAGGTITDVNLKSTTGTTLRFSNGQFFVVSPQGTQISVVANGSCGNTDNWSFTLDDEAPAGNVNCANTPIGQGGTFRPDNASFNGSLLSGFDGQDSTGTWQLKIVDTDTNAAKPNITAWGLEICVNN